MLFIRMLRAAVLDHKLYEELRRDPIALVQAFVVVLLASLSAVAALVILSLAFDDVDLTGPEAVGIGLSMMPGVWSLFALSGVLFGAMLRDARQEKRPMGELVAAVGVSSSPGVLLFLMALPPIAPILALLIPLWQVAAMAVAIKATLGLSLTRSLFSIAPGLVVALFIGAAIGQAVENGS